MRFLLACFLCSLLVPAGLCAGETFSYNAQGQWTGVCNAGNTGRQSPIDIVVANVRADSTMTPLEFSSGWNEGISGPFSNTGHNVQFTLNGDGPTTVTPVGTYQVLQFHMHWGNRSGSGSEHRINGEQSEVEIHIVHQRVGAGGDAGNALAVVGVFADVSSEPVSGIWQQLNVSAVTAVGSAINVSGIILSSLLPSSRPYYYYEGSLTTPPCTESVQWFVLKERITVPMAFVESLRSIAQDDGPGMFNYRYVQQLGSRSVFDSGSIVTNAPFMLVCLLTILSVQLAVFV